MKLTFLGGAQEVTGSNYLLQSDDMSILIDCGLHQGQDDARRVNENGFAFDPKKISAVLVTHGHIDHIGRIPQLISKGYAGPIYSTPPTHDSAYELLLDAHHLMEHDATEAHPALYTIDDIDTAMSHWKTVRYHESFSVGPFGIKFFNSGHILGSASIVVEVEGKKIVFSGDLGNIPAPLVKDTEYIADADYALIESAYGNRVHESVEERKNILEDLIEDTVRLKGTLMIPAFALERTQDLLYEINDLIEHGRIPRVPVYIDSPLAIKLTSVYQKYADDPEYFDKEAIAKLRKEGEIFNFSGLHFTLTKEESKEINNVLPPKVIIAGSGMSNGGRILHHEMRYLSDPQSTILFVGFQSEGTLGRRIIDKAPSVTIFGEKIPVRCRVKAIGGYSAHADQPLLIKWIESMRNSVKKVFVVQGELDQSEPLAAKIRDTFAIDASVPRAGSVVEL